MRAALLATLALALAACTHGAPPATPAGSPAASAAPSADAGVRLEYPLARKVDVVDDYQGTKVADPYRWLEDPTTPGYREWIDAENALAFQTRYGPDTFVVVEKWESMAALEAHAAAPHMKAYGAQTKDLIASRVIHILSPA